MTQQPRRHHIVPQLYLRRFARKERLVAIEVATRRILENQHIRNVAFESDAYRPDGLLVDCGINVEGEIAELESRLAVALREFPNEFPPSRELRMAVSDIVLFQLVRSPRKRTQYGSDRWGQWLLSLGLLLNDPEDPARRSGLRDSDWLDVRENARSAISERRWLLYEAPADGTAEFVSCDSPVYLAGGRPDQRGLIRHSDVHQFFLPLDRYHMLIMEQGSPDEDRRVTATVDEVVELNLMTARAAVRFAYAHPGVNRRWLMSSVPRPADQHDRD